MANRVPAHATTGYTLHRPPLPLIYKPPSCGDAPPGCDVERCMQKRDLRQAKHNASAVLALCARCECSLCLICAKPRNRWTSPLGQMLETVTTSTDPPFTFAYNPNDADMQRMREQLVLEPVLTHARGCLATLDLSENRLGDVACPSPNPRLRLGSAHS